MPNKNITRQEAATMLARFLPKTGNQSEASLDTYSDVTQISNWAKSAMSVIVNKGYMTGRSNGQLFPKGILTRAEAIKIIGMILEKETIIREDVSVKNAGEILKDKIYIGDITIEKSVGEGDASIENLSALSKVYVLGGGVNTVEINNSKIIQLIVCKEGTKVRILTNGDTIIQKAFLFNSNFLVDSNGTTAVSEEGGYETIINVNGDITVETAIRLAGEISKRLNSTGTLTQEQLKEAIAIISGSTATIDENGLIVITLQSEDKTSNNRKGGSGSPDIPQLVING